MLKFALIISTAILLSSCAPDTKGNNERKSSSNVIEPVEVYNELEDGEYCAEVIYSNPNTGKVSEYELIVEVTKGKLTVLHWPNGGWLDESHFTPTKINDDGSVSILSDKGYKYEIQLMGERPCEFETQ